MTGMLRSVLKLNIGTAVFFTVRTAAPCQLAVSKDKYDDGRLLNMLESRQVNQGKLVENVNPRWRIAAIPMISSSSKALNHRPRPSGRRS